MNTQEPTILIAYPKDFICYPKFERKINKIFSSLSHFSLAMINDYNGFIAKKMEHEMRLHDAITTSEDHLEKITHAVIFNDGKSFNHIIDELKHKNILARVINTTITKVVNIDKNEKYDIYIGRGSAWGNPYAIGFDGDDREEVIRKYKYDFDKGYLKSSKQNLLKLKGKILGCHCKPAACHGDVLVEYLNSLDDEI
jgi:hypothetical protein